MSVNRLAEEPLITPDPCQPQLSPSGPLPVFTRIANCGERFAV
jgi:hypothetical protein